MNMKKIVFFSWDLDIGGVQSSLINSANYLADKFEVHIVYYGEKTSRILELDSRIQTHKMKRRQKWYRLVPFGILKLISHPKVEINEIDLAINFDGYHPEITSDMTKLNIKKKILWIHSDLIQKLKYDKKFNLVWTNFKKQCSFFDEFVFVSSGAKDALTPYLPTSDTTRIIPNRLNVQRIWKLAGKMEESKENATTEFCFLGRLAPIKRVDEILKVLATINGKWYFHIIGDGPEKESLEQLAEELNINEKVFFHGALTNPFEELQKMDALILNSYYEGQALVLLEAKALGLQVVFPKHLEKYVVGVTGVEDIRKAILEIMETPVPSKVRDDLSDYEELVERAWDQMLKENL